MAVGAAQREISQPTTHAQSRTARTAQARARRNLIAHIVLIIFVIGALFPFYWMVATSVKTLTESLQSPPTLLPEHLQIKNYANAFHQAPFGRYFLNTLFIAGITVLCNLTTSVLAAYSFALTDFPGKRVIFALLLTTLMIPFEVTLIPNFILIKNLHLYNTYWAQIVPWAAGTFGIFLVRQFFLSIPKEIFEAAVIDGASAWGVLWKVAVPLARPALVTLALFSFISSWNSFVWPLIVTTSDNVRPIQVGLRQLTSDAGNNNFPLLMAGTALTIVPIAILYFFVQRQLIEGVASSGVKG
jgi:ABC-type glycerol-3-phosphate transport system permease component